MRTIVGLCEFDLRTSGVSGHGTMILVGQYDSAYVRRVAVSLHVLEFECEHDTRSVFADFDAMRATNPLGRIPSLVLDDGEVLIDSAAILDWLDQTVGPARALLPAAGPSGGRAPPDCARYRRDRQGRRRRLRAPDAARGAALARVDPALPDPGRRRHRRARGRAWSPGNTLDQAEITTACMLRYVAMADPELLPPGRHPTLEALSERCEALPEFQATRVRRSKEPVSGRSETVAAQSRRITSVSPQRAGHWRRREC